MLSIIIVNTGEGTNENASYKYYVSVNGKNIKIGEITGHNRNNGWADLLKMIAKENLISKNIKE